MTPFDINHPLDAFNIQDNEDIWVFAYGSLMWKPDFNYIEVKPAHICGYHRRFCIQSRYHRGTPDNPGLVLGLDRGGSCRGLGFKINSNELSSALEILWRREMLVLPNAYKARRVPIVLDNDISNKVPACVFVSNRKNEHYVENKCHEHASKIIQSAHGTSGSNFEYLERTILQLRDLGIHDAGLERIYMQNTQ